MANFVPNTWLRLNTVDVNEHFHEHLQVTVDVDVCVIVNVADLSSSAGRGLLPAVSLVSLVVKLLFDHQRHKGHNGKNQRVDLQVSSATFQKQTAFSTSHTDWL